MITIIIYSKNSMLYRHCDWLSVGSVSFCLSTFFFFLISCNGNKFAEKSPNWLEKKIISGVRLSETFPSVSSTKNKIYISFVINIFFVLLGKLTSIRHVYVSTLYVNYFTLLLTMTDGCLVYSQACVYQLNSQKHVYMGLYEMFIQTVELFMKTLNSLGV